MEHEAIIEQFRKEYKELLCITNQTLLKNKSLFLVVKIYMFVYDSEIILKYHESLKKELFLMTSKLDKVINDYENKLKELFKDDITINFGALNIESISFSHKMRGVQSGELATVTFSNSNNVKSSTNFFIKTHQNGAVTAPSAASKPVDIKELFVYKALENLKIGPKVRFFFDDRDATKEFFISTQEAGSTILKPNDVEKPNNFPFKLANHYKVSIAITDDIKKEFDSYEPNLFESLKRELTLVDMVSRIFNLGDCSINSSNFGFIEQENDLSACIFDFRTSFNVYENNKIFKYFEHGNKQFCYTRNSLLWALIAAESRNEKIARAFLVFKRLNTSTFYSTIDQSIQEIVIYINSSNINQLKENLKNIYSNL
ncbi:uncharacterized protein LOC136092862 [Hydra vulgaris]|uniref:uncharacterized protein LOC136092862 n=1 Tax=Hydra vulgaris TaxID=6087 RepID=UPI0032EA2F3C